jgi:hypothetical protein
LQPPARLLIACDPRRSPDRGTLALIGELARTAAATHVWLLPAPEAEGLDPVRLETWQDALRHLQLSQSQELPRAWLATGQDGEAEEGQP